jgi:hypothetical protein
MLDPQTVYLISIDQYFPTPDEVKEMARVLHAQECSKQASLLTGTLIEANVQIGRA